MSEQTETQKTFAKKLEEAIQCIGFFNKNYEIKIMKQENEVILIIQHVSSSLFLALKEPLKQSNYLYIIYTHNESFLRIVFYPNQAI